MLLDRLGVLAEADAHTLGWREGEEAAVLRDGVLYRRPGAGLRPHAFHHRLAVGALYTFLRTAGAREGELLVEPRLPFRSLASGDALLCPDLLYRSRWFLEIDLGSEGPRQLRHRALLYAEGLAHHPGTVVVLARVPERLTEFARLVPGAEVVADRRELARLLGLPG